MLFNTGENCVRVAALLITELWRCRQCKLQSKSNAINSRQNKRWLIFFPERPNGGNRLFKRLIHVTSKLLPPPCQKSLCALIFIHVLYVFCCREPSLCMHDNLFIHHNKQDRHPQYACSADFVHYACLMMLFFLFSPTTVSTSAIQEKSENNSDLTCPHFSVSIKRLLNITHSSHMHTHAHTQV